MIVEIKYGKQDKSRIVINDVENVEIYKSGKKVIVNIIYKEDFKYMYFSKHYSQDDFSKYVVVNLA